MKNILMTPRWRKVQRGFSLVTAIFLLVVLAGLGAAMVTFFTVQQQSSTLDVLSARGYQAARAGIDWAAFQIVQSSVAAPPAGAGGFAATCQAGVTSSSVAVAGTLAGFSPVLVACTAASVVENANTVWMYSVTATASGVNGAPAGAPNYVERQMTVTIAQ
jgi:MSHA biogenesis protein MshP